MDNVEDLSERVRALGAELASLSARIGALETVPPPAPREAADPDPFWILEGLKARHAAPGVVAYAGAVSTPAGPVEWQMGVPVESLLEAEWSAAAPVLSALAHPLRLSLLHAILGGVTHVGDLAEDARLGTTGQLYHHLNQLVAGGWLLAAGRGQFGIPPERVVPLLAILAAVRRGA